MQCRKVCLPLTLRQALTSFEKRGQEFARDVYAACALHLTVYERRFVQDGLPECDLAQRVDNHPSFNSLIPMGFIPG
jgi:hypothetical protein